MGLLTEDFGGRVGVGSNGGVESRGTVEADTFGNAEVSEFDAENGEGGGVGEEDWEDILLIRLARDF